MKPAAPPTVFVVDDDALVRAAIHGMLKSVGLHSETFATPQEFLQSKPADGPSCLVLDVRLRGANGLDFQHELADAGVRIPIIFITGHGDIPMTVKAMKSGAVEFLTKPFVGFNIPHRSERQSSGQKREETSKQKYATTSAQKCEHRGGRPAYPAADQPTEDLVVYRGCQPHAQAGS